MLELADVSGGYGKLAVLDHVSFVLPAGSMTAVLGPRGAGKSTLLKAVFGLAEIPTGRIRLAGRDVTGLAPRLMQAAGVAYVPRGGNVVADLSVRHNLELGAGGADDPHRLREALDRTLDRFPLLREHRDRRAGLLSPVERKRLEIARALLADPHLILIDEPTAGLTPNHVGEVLALLGGLRDEGRSILLAERRVRAALTVSDGGLVLDQGRIRLQDHATALLADPRIGPLALSGEAAADPATDA